jgi:cell wall-associated NlpC family hydrolase
VHTRLSGSTTAIRTLWRRGAAIPLGLLAVGGLVLSVGGSAAAAPQPTPAQVQQELSKLNAQAQVLDQKYDAAEQQLMAANQQLQAIDTEIGRYQAHYKLLRAQVGEIAAQEYETGEIDTPEALITAKNPQSILDQASILEQLSSSNSTEMTQFITAAKQLTSAQESAQRLRDGKLAVAQQLASEKSQNAKLTAQQQALLRQLTPQQVTNVGLGGSSGGSLPANIGNSSTPTGSQALQAVAFARAQVGCWYVFGGTGPCADGFDCSGLTQAAWASAGVAIPRTSYEQMAELPAVSLSELQPGDILGFIGNGHVGIYIGNGELIHAPQTGQQVQYASLTGWFAANLDGAVRP